MLPSAFALWLICWNTITVNLATPNRILSLAAGVSRVALNGVDNTVFTFLHDAHMVGFSVSFPVEEDDHSRCWLNAVMHALASDTVDTFIADVGLTGTMVSFTQTADFRGERAHSEDIEAASLQDFADDNLQGLRDIEAVLERLLEAVLSMELGDEMIAKANLNYQAKMAIVNRGG